MLCPQQNSSTGTSTATIPRKRKPCEPAAVPAALRPCAPERTHATAAPVPARLDLLHLVVRVSTRSESTSSATRMPNACQNSHRKSGHSWLRVPSRVVSHRLPALRATTSVFMCESRYIRQGAVVRLFGRVTCTELRESPRQLRSSYRNQHFQNIYCYEYSPALF